MFLKGSTIWGTDVFSFALWFWGTDHGGPFIRFEPNPPPADFRFPQQETPQPEETRWRPRLFDYIYVSFTNSIAFSPTDAMPFDPPGEAADDVRVRRLCRSDPARHRAGGQHFQVG